MNNIITNNSSVMMMNKKKKTTQGRKKIEIKKIDKVSNRQVTFSKRRTGLFKKASELCILTGTEIAIIVQSSRKRLYAFGHPSVDRVIDRYANGSSLTPSTSPPSSISSTRRINSTNPTTMSAAEINAHNSEYAKLCQELDVENKKLEHQEKVNSMNYVSNEFWWDKPIDHMGLEELEQYAVALEELRKNVLTRADEVALLRKSHNMGIMNNVDLNQIMSPSVGAAYEDDHVPSANSMVPYGFGI